jgi:hypothetical protein
VSENGVLRGTYGPERDEVTGGGNCIMRGFINCTLHQILLGRSDQGNEMGGACSMHGRDEKIHKLFVRKREEDTIWWKNREMSG